ncbi:MAG: InlB B-repeat-containing protein [Methanocella sp.]
MTIGKSGDGATSPSPGIHSYAKGTVVPLSATPASGYRFDGWEGEDAASIVDSRIVVDSDKALRARFTELTPTLTLIVDKATGSAPLQVNFTAQLTNFSGTVLYYEFHIEDGPNGETSQTIRTDQTQVSHVYNDPGTYYADVIMYGQLPDGFSYQLEDVLYITVTSPTP